MKKALSLIAPLLLANAAYANSFDFGFAVFNQYVDIDYKQKMASGIETTLSGNDSIFNYELNLGYTWNINSGFDIGVLAFYDFNGPTDKQTISTTGYVEYRLKEIYGITFLPGFKLTQNTKVYLDLGVGYLTQTLNDKNLTLTQDLSEKESSIAFRYGAGLDTMIYDQLSLKVFYVVMDGANKVEFDNTNSSVGKVSAEPVIYNFGMGLTYHFSF